MDSGWGTWKGVGPSPLSSAPTRSRVFLGRFGPWMPGWHRKKHIIIYIYILWKYGLLWYQNDPLGGNSNILHGFLPPNITCPIIAGSEATPGDGIHVFPTPSAGQGGVRSWARRVRWIFGKNQKKWQFYRRKWWKLRIKIDQLWDSGIIYTTKMFLGCKWATLQAWRRSDPADFLLQKRNEIMFWSLKLLLYRDPNGRDMRGVLFDFGILLDLPSGELT